MFRFRRSRGKKAEGSSLLLSSLRQTTGFLTGVAGKLCHLSGYTVLQHSNSTSVLIMRVYYALSAHVEVLQGSILFFNLDPIKR
ncbi:hypothetical protein RRG08_024969 [Elysia crispata]|uniref:Uncharacterized protein n=1 Tax=Elysia crispata TaxID=231223 RepID=A0AAE1ATM6_9GAST|nr:hypothetical protein RRG08_024969 [Elysia crispata]